MCMNCGCGELDKRHQPTDITREDVQRAADGGGISMEEAASNLQSSLQKLDTSSSDQTGSPAASA